MKKLAVVLLTALVLAGCGSAPSSTSKTIQVFAAASLKDPFTALGKKFEASHPGVKVRFNFGGSPDLVTQVNQGAPADVLATASTATMANAKGVQDIATFAKNTAEIVVPAANPAHITGLADLARPGVKVALCQAQVPCGAIAAKVLAKAHLSVTPVTQEADVKSVLAKVSLGEVDAGVVYVTDAKAGQNVLGLPIPPSSNESTAYPIGDVAASKNLALAKEFVALVTSKDGRDALAEAGFAQP